MLKELKYKDIKPVYKIDEYGNIYSKYKKRCHITYEYNFPKSIVRRDVKRKIL